jgi:Transposase IS66 family
MTSGRRELPRRTHPDHARRADRCGLSHSGVINSGVEGICCSVPSPRPPRPAAPARCGRGLLSGVLAGCLVSALLFTSDVDPGTGEPEGSPHVLIIRPPGGKVTWLQARSSRRAAAITAILGFFTGFLVTDGYTAYQRMPPKWLFLNLNVRCGSPVSSARLVL